MTNLPPVLRESESDLLLLGPHALFTECMRDSVPVVLSYRDGHKYQGYMKWVDKHCNCLMDNVMELWWENGRLQECQHHGLFLRGDGLITAVKAVL